MAAHNSAAQLKRLPVTVDPDTVMLMHLSALEHGGIGCWFVVHDRKPCCYYGHQLALQRAYPEARTALRTLRRALETAAGEDITGVSDRIVTSERRIPFDRWLRTYQRNYGKLAT